MNQRLNHKGVFIELVNSREDFYLIYVYRKSQLYNILSAREVNSFLQEYGYENDSVLDIYAYIEKLKKRIRGCACFPHEIGVFLGYPLADVKEFIEHKGEGCALCGEWKVYHDVQNTKCFFCKLKKCKDVYLRIYNDGRNLSDMTVSA